MSPRSHRAPKVRPPGESAIGTALRLFLVVPLPEPVKERVSGITRDLATEGWPVRWTSAAGAHITLHFLGDTPPERAELLRLALPTVVARHQAFNLRTAELGVFPNPRRPRVLWLGLHGPVHRVVTLHEDLGATLRALAFPADDQSINPHITLGRVRDPRRGGTKDLPAQIQQRFERELTVPRSALVVPVTHVALYRSMLSPQGARYMAIGEFPLGTARR